MALQGMLGTCSSFGCLQPRVTREIQLRVPASLHYLEHFFTLFHSLPLHESHLNTGLLIAKIQANLTRNKESLLLNLFLCGLKVFQFSSWSVPHGRNSWSLKWGLCFLYIYIYIDIDIYIYIYIYILMSRNVLPNRGLWLTRICVG